jgi:capsular exopolysaccharide synthesis family protein
LSVAPLPDSRLVRIHYDSPNPKEAAAVANAVAENFVNMTLERRYDATGYAKKFLEERIAQVRAALEDSEKQLVEYAGKREIVDFDDKLGNLRETLNALSTALVQAETKRIEAEATYVQAQRGGGASALKVLENEAIQSLKARRGELELTYQENLKVYKPGYSKMQQLRRQIEEIDQQISIETATITDTIVDAVRAKFAATVEEEAALRARVHEAKAEMLDLQNRSIDYQTLKRDVVTNRELYDGLLQRLKEVGVVGGLTTNNISIVDRAKVPSAPYKPNLRSNLTKAILIGLFVGVLLALLFEYLDDTVKTSGEIERRGRMPVLGTLPMASAKQYGIPEEGIPLLAATRPTAPLAEAARSLRTSLAFSTTEGAPSVTHVTSAGPGEGKTTVAVNLAVALAQGGNKVLIIDADLRAPSLHRVFSQPNGAGLTNYLAGDAQPAEIAIPTEVTRLFAITSGPLPPNPAELLSSAKMRDLLGLASERFDYVVLDGPPVIGLADAPVLASLARGTVFVVEAGVTRYGDFEGAIKRLRAANASLVGAVLSKFGRRGKRYGDGTNYDYHYTYSYGPGSRTALPEEA